MPAMARTPFAPPPPHVVVSSDGYFDVYPPAGRTDGDRPAYRGRLAELGPGIRGGDDRLAVRPGSGAPPGPGARGGPARLAVRRGSAPLAAAVTAWSAVHGAAANRGDLGGGRDGHEAK